MEHNPICSPTRVNHFISLRTLQEAFWPGSSPTWCFAIVLLYCSFMGVSLAVSLMDKLIYQILSTLKLREQRSGRVEINLSLVAELLTRFCFEDGHFKKRKGGKGKKKRGKKHLRSYLTTNNAYLPHSSCIIKHNKWPAKVHLMYF